MKTVFNLLKENGFVYYPDSDTDNIGDGCYYLNTNDRGQFILDFLEESGFICNGFKRNRDSVNDCFWYFLSNPAHPGSVKLVTIFENNDNFTFRYIIIDD